MSFEYEPASVTLWQNLWETRAPGDVLETTWNEWFSYLGQRTAYLGDRHHAAWSPAVFAPCTRVLAHVRAVSAIVLPVGAPPRRLFGSLHGFAYTSPRHRHHDPHWLAVLPFTRQATAKEHATALRWLAGRSVEVSTAVDRQRITAASAFPLPGTTPGAPFDCVSLDGDPLDPAAGARSD